MKKVLYIQHVYLCIQRYTYYKVRFYIQYNFNYIEYKKREKNDSKKRRNREKIAQKGPRKK